MCALTTGGHLLNGSSTARLRSGPGISHDRTRSRSAVCIGLKNVIASYCQAIRYENEKLQVGGFYDMGNY